MIPPSEWLNDVWGGEGAFADLPEAENIIGAVMGHYNRVALDLADDPEAYAPVLEVILESGKVMWEAWIDGFEQAMRLRADAWEEIVRSGDGEAAAAVNLILAMHELHYDQSDLSEEAAEELDRTVPDMIPSMVRSLNAWAKSRGKGNKPAGASHGDWFGIDDVPAFGRKVGRNEPWPGEQPSGDCPENGRFSSTCS